MNDHYFSPSPGSPQRRRAVRATVWGNELRLESASGVFSHGRVDVGTRVLVRSSRPGPSARAVLDLGCGTGVLATALGLVLPDATVWAVDVNERARALTRDNTVAHGLGDRVRVVAPEDVPSDLVLDEVWSNPPARIGKPALQELLLGWLRRLAPDGRAVLVIGRNLGADSHQRFLVERGWACRRVASAKGFRVLEVTAVAGR